MTPVLFFNAIRTNTFSAYEENPMNLLIKTKCNAMKEFLKVTVRSTPQDEKLIKEVMADMMGQFGNYLKVTKRTNQLSVTEFTILYYDLDYFLRKDLRQNRYYSVKDIRSFSVSFRLIFEKLEKVCFYNEAYLMKVFEDNSNKFLQWLLEVTESLPVSR